MFCPAVQGSGDVPSTAAGRSLGAGSWRQGYPPPPTCAQPQEHSPHNSRRPPQATAQATCGPVTPYQHVMGERRCGSPRGPGPTPDGPGAISGQIPYRRALSQFSKEEQVDLALLDSRQSRASCNNVAGASRRWEASGKVSRQATARQDNKKRPWWKELLESLCSHQQLPRLVRLDLDAHVDDSPGRVGL